MKSTKITSILISASISILVLAGCGTSPRTVPNATKVPMNNTTKPSQSKQTNESIQSNQPNQTAMRKTIYSKALNELVTAKSITLAQSKKVLASLTRNMSQETNNKNQTNTTPSVGAPIPGEGAGTLAPTPSTGTTNNTANIINSISSLVNSNVITQAQADIISHKIQSAMNNM